MGSAKRKRVYRYLRIVLGAFLVVFLLYLVLAIGFFLGLWGDFELG